MRASLLVSGTLAFCIGSCVALGSGVAQTDTPVDEVDRLPIPNERLKEGALGDRASKIQSQNKSRLTKQLVSSGGLLISFDTDKDGVLTRLEMETGSIVAFAEADADENGTVTALEQADWVAGLEASDASLVNPVRFDPNLDGRSTKSEFQKVVTQLFDQYADAEKDDITLQDLYVIPKRPKRAEQRQMQPSQERKRTPLQIDLRN